MNERRSDFELLRDFFKHGEQVAFATVVRRHVDLVYATALRKVEDPGAAEEVAQNVFGVLARKAWQFAPDDSVPAWLHRTTLLDTKEWWRGELRRRRREETAAELGTTMKTPDEQPALRALIPLLDEALLSLREKDRTALLLRFYESQSLRELGSSLGVGEDAAQKRVASALEKLTGFFQRRGFRTATTAATAAALQQTAAGAPAVVLNAIVQSAMALTPPALGGLMFVLTRIASLSKIQTAVLCLAIAAVPVALEIQTRRKAQTELAQAESRLSAAQIEFSVMKTEIQRLNESATRLEDTLSTARNAAIYSGEMERQFSDWKERARTRLLAADYQWPDDLPFVRIPKAILPQLKVREPIEQPGVIKQEARELLGLTPAERESSESALQKHFAAMDSLLESSRYETNAPTVARLPNEILAGKAWGVPALGNEVKQRAEELQSALKTTLGEERWAMIEEQLKLSGASSLRSTLGFDTGEHGQELAVWVKEQNGKLLAGFGWGTQNSSFSSSDLLLSFFLPGVELPGGATVENYWSKQLSPVLTRPALEWLREQAENRLNKEGDQ